LQSLIPVLLSRGATPDVKSTRGDVTPLHLACGAGNTAIVELLLRQGCAMEVADCFGSFPADHAIRNGFHPLAALLQEKILNEKGIKAESSQHRLLDEVSQKKQLKQYEKMRVQEAFASLSLKDKLALNIHFKKRMHAKHLRKLTFPGGENGTIAEVEIESDSGNEIQNGLVNNEDVKNADNNDLKDEHSNSGSDDDDLSSVITDTDKGSLDIAMKLMNAKVRSLAKKHYFGFFQLISSY
jgi:ankyrin repeat protein